MLKIFINGRDATKNIDVFSVKQVSQQNNRTDQLSFSCTNLDITENQEVVLFDGSYTSQSSTGTRIYLSDSYEWNQKYRVGDFVYIDDFTNEPTRSNRYTITGVDTNYIDIDRSASVNTNTFVGKKSFGGVIVQITQKKMSKCSDIIRDVRCSDYSVFFDRKAVVETYNDMFFREILGRMVYEFVANDSQETVDGLESAWVQSGTASVMTDDASDRMSGNFSQNTSMTAGTATRTKTISSLDLSSYDNIRYRWKTLGDIDTFKIRIGTDSSNYYEYINPRVGLDFLDCRNYESIRLSTPDSTVGSPSLSNIERLQYELSSNVHIDDIWFDEILASTGGITIDNSLRGTKKYGRIKYKSVKPTRAVEDLTKQYDEYWYIDADRDFHYYYTQSQRPCPITIDSASKDYSNLQIKPDATKIVNRQQVEGSEAATTTIHIQEEVADGQKESFRLDYRPVGERVEAGVTYDGLKAFVNGVAKTVGIENITDPSTVDFIYNFQEKFIRNASVATLNSGDILRLEYYPYQLISVRYQDSSAISAMQSLTGGDGIYDGQIIIDKRLETIQDVRQRAKVEVDRYKNPQINVSFVTNKDGVKIGQMVDIDIDGFQDRLVVQSINSKYIARGMREHRVKCATSLFGYVEFFQLLLKEKEKTVGALDNEIVIIPINNDETVSIDSNYALEKKDRVYQLGEIKEKRYSMVFESGSSVGDDLGFGPQWKISGDGAEFVTATKDEDGSAVLIDNQSGGNVTFKTLYPRSQTNGMEHTITIRLDITNANNTIVANILEYADKSSTTPSNTITIASLSSETVDTRDYSIDYTASTNRYGIEFIVGAGCTFQITDMRWRENRSSTVANPGRLGFMTLG